MNSISHCIHNHHFIVVYSTFHWVRYPLRLWHRCFSVNFAKFLTIPFLQNTCGRQLLLYGNNLFIIVFKSSPCLLNGDCVCVYVCLYWRLLPTARCLWRTRGVRINDVMLWVLMLVFLPSSFISISKYVIFHLWRRNSSSSTNWRENDMI